MVVGHACRFTLYFYKYARKFHVHARKRVEEASRHQSSHAHEIIHRDTVCALAQLHNAKLERGEDARRGGARIPEHLRGEWPASPSALLAAIGRWRLACHADLLRALRLLEDASIDAVRLFAGLYLATSAICNSHSEIWG